MIYANTIVLLIDMFLIIIYFYTSIIYRNILLHACFLLTGNMKHLQNVKNILYIYCIYTYM